MAYKDYPLGKGEMVDKTKAKNAWNQGKIGIYDITIRMGLNTNYPVLYNHKNNTAIATLGEFRGC